MAQSLRRNGLAPHVFDIRADVTNAFAREGGTAHTSAASLAAASDVLISVVVDAAPADREPSEPKPASTPLAPPPDGATNAAT